MFKKKGAASDGPPCRGCRRGVSSARDGPLIFYRVSLFHRLALFLVGIRMLTNPETARRGMQLAGRPAWPWACGDARPITTSSATGDPRRLVVGTVVGVPMGLLIR